MAINIYTKPIKLTGELVETPEYTQEITIERDGVSTMEVISFPQCLEEMTEEIRKRFISGMIVNHLQNNL